MSATTGRPSGDATITRPAAETWRVIAALRTPRSIPDDPRTAVAIAAACASVRLKTAAGEAIAAAGNTAPPDLRARIAALPDDRIDPSVLERCVRANLAALGARGAAPEVDLDAWTARIAGESWFRAGDGNVVRRDTASGRWRRLGDERRAAAGQDLRPLATLSAVYMEGIDPPWLVRRVAAATPRRDDGFQPRLWLVHEDPDSLLDALAVLDLSAVLSEPRTIVHLGPGADERFAEDLRARSAGDLTGATVSQTGDGRIAAIVRRAGAAQEAEQHDLRTRVTARWRPRDAGWWRRRHSEAHTGDGPPLRVLVPTTRYSTYVRHASEDLCESLRAAGVDARCLVEPDDHTRFTALATLRALDDFDPDLVILANYPRRSTPVPEGVPFVCWIQDPLPHLFEAGGGAAQTPLDFVCGHVFPELHRSLGHARDQALRFPIAASHRKFHPGPAGDEFDCELAYVSHHAAAPDDLHARLLSDAREAPALQRIMTRLRGELPRLLADDTPRAVDEDLRALTRRVVTEILGPGADDAVVAMVHRTYLCPMAERTVRHETLAWASEIVERRGWRFHLYGRGWDRHPVLARYAAGPLPHGDALRRAYAGARAHLHVSVHLVLHQRIVECLLAGGLPLCRLSADEANLALTALLAEVSSEEADRFDAHRVGYDADAHPALRQWRSMRAALDLPADDPLWLTTSQRRTLQARAPGLRRIPRAVSLLGGLDCFFRDRAELEARLDVAVDDGDRRRRLIETARTRARAALTFDVFARRLLDFVRERLSMHDHTAILAALAGDWDEYDLLADAGDIGPDDPSAPTGPSIGRMTNDLELDGRVLRCTYASAPDAAGAAATMRGSYLLTFNDRDGRYEAMVYDDVRSGFSSYAGEPGADGALTLTGETFDPVTQRTETLRHVTRLVGPDTFTMHHFRRGHDGAFAPVVGRLFRRRP